MVNRNQGMESNIRCCIITSAQITKLSHNFLNDFQKFIQHKISTLIVYSLHHRFPTYLINNSKSNKNSCKNKNSLRRVDAQAQKFVYDFYGVNEST